MKSEIKIVLVKMGKAKNCTVAERASIIALYNEGLSYREIGERFNCSKKKVFNAILHFKNNGTTQELQRKLRPRKTSILDDRLIVRLSKKDPFASSKQIATTLRETLQLNISSRTIRRRLQEAGLNGRMARKTPKVSTKNLKKRLELAREYANWDMRTWKNILFSDETKVNLVGSDGRCWVRRGINTAFEPRYTKKCVKFGGGNVMVWGCFSWKGVGPICRINGKMDQHQYLKILEEVMEPYAEEHLSVLWKFQQDNDPKHTARIVKQWLRTKSITEMEWPASSPDLNPIENLWAEVKRAVGQRTYSSQNELYQAIEEAWYNIPQRTCQRLIESMPRRLSQVICNKGHPTKY